MLSELGMGPSAPPFGGIVAAFLAAGSSSTAASAFAFPRPPRFVGMFAFAANGRSLTTSTGSDTAAGPCFPEESVLLNQICWV